MSYSFVSGFSECRDKNDKAARLRIMSYILRWWKTMADYITFLIIGDGTQH